MNYGGPPQHPPYVPQPQPAQTQPDPEHHVCASGSVWCSGLAPCTACFHLLRDVVMPRVIVQAGLNGLAAMMLYDLVTAMRRQGVDPLTHFGVPVDLARIDPTEQIRSALAGLEQGFRFLHERIASEPALQREIVQTRVRGDGLQYPAPPGYDPNDPSYGTAPGYPPGYGAPPAYAGPAAPGYPPFDPVGVPVAGGYEHIGRHAPPVRVPDPSTPEAPGPPTVDPFDRLGISGAPAGGGVVLGSIFGAPQSATNAGAGPRPDGGPSAAQAAVPAEVPLERLAPRDPAPRAPSGPLGVDDVALAALPLDDEAAMTPSADRADRTRNGAGS